MSEPRDMPEAARGTGDMPDLPEEDRQHVDEQTAHGLPRGGTKEENLRRVVRQVKEQGRREQEALGEEPPEPEERPEG